MGGWSHPDISLEDLIKLIKGFVDILILASGYQSSGQFAHWDPQNIKKTFQWALFFQNVLRDLDDYQGSAEELDAALSELTSNPYFPQGLKELSTATLRRARTFVLQHLIHTLPLSDPHLKAFLVATIEMDIDELQKTENNCLHVYLDKLNLLTATLSPGRGITEDSPFTRPGNASHGKEENSTHADLTKSTIEEITRRKLAVSCISATETGMNCLTTILNLCTPSELSNKSFDQQKQVTGSVAEEQLLELLTWRTRNLSYLLDNRIMRLVSGASMIFSAPKVQWVQVFERLNMSTNTDDDLRDTIELLLIGLIANRWTLLLEHFMSVSNDFHGSLTMHTLYHEVHTLFLEKYHNVQSKEEMKSSKEQGVLEYLEVLLSHQLHQLWKLSPVLVAMSLPSWSQLFRLYLSELLSQFKGKSPTIRCCKCIGDNKEHKDCEVSERLWCIYIFHVHRST